MRDALAPQDNLYTLAVRDGEEESLRVVAALTGILAARESPSVLLDVLVQPDVRIVTMTVTEKGYVADVVSGALKQDDADVRHDIRMPYAPRTALGFLCEALRRRRALGLAPFTILSCDNLPGNGRVLHAALTELAALQDPAFGRFVADEVACPSSMVDRIVPATTDEDRRRIASVLGCSDEGAVVTEPFSQWVVEDRFPSGRPGWERAGVEFVSDVSAHERTKLRLLNGAHTLLAAGGLLLGLETIADAVADPLLIRLLEGYWQEAAATLPSVIDTRAYCDRLRHRFRNRALRHRLDQIATDSSLKLPQRILSPFLDRWQEGRHSPCMALAVAIWMRSMSGRDEVGRPFRLVDPLLKPGGLPIPSDSADAVVGFYLDRREIFGASEWRDTKLRSMIEMAYGAIARDGLQTVLDRLTRALT